MLCGRAKCCQTNPLHRFANMCQDPELCQDILSPRTNLAQTGMDRPQFELIYSHPVQASPLCFFFFLLLTHSERNQHFNTQSELFSTDIMRMNIIIKTPGREGGDFISLLEQYLISIFPALDQDSAQLPNMPGCKLNETNMTRLTDYDSPLSLRGATEHLYCNHRREPESPSSPARLSPPCAVIPMVAMSTTPARGLSWALCEEMDCRTLPKKKPPSKSFLPTVVLGDSLLIRHTHHL